MSCQHKFNIYYSEVFECFYCEDCQKEMSEDYLAEHQYTQYSYMVCWAHGHPNWHQEYVQLLPFTEKEELTAEELRNRIDYELSSKLGYGETARLLSIELNVVTNQQMYHFSDKTAQDFIGLPSKYLQEYK